MARAEICPICRGEVEEVYNNEYECNKCGTEFYVDEKGKKHITVKGDPRN